MIKLVTETVYLVDDKYCQQRCMTHVNAKHVWNGIKM